MNSSQLARYTNLCSNLLQTYYKHCHNFWISAGRWMRCVCVWGGGGVGMRNGEVGREIAQ